MANIVDFSKLMINEYPSTFVRGSSFPLDQTSLWTSLDAAKEYAKKQGDSSISYVGQLLTVYENGSTTVWKINDAAGNLVQIDSEVVINVDVDPADGKVYATVPVKSADPSKWIQSNQTDGTFRSVAYGNGKFVAVECNGNGIWYSTDGIDWDQSNKPDGAFVSVTYGNGKFVAVSDGEGIWYSTDGTVWTQSNKPDGSFDPLIYADGKFITNGEGGFWYSTDGIDWTQSNITDKYFHTITYANGKFIAISDGIWYSTDGIDWTQSSKADGFFISIAYGNGKFVAGGNGEGIWYSTDGIDWTQSSKTDGDFSSIAYGNGKFVALDTSFNEGIWYSTDGIVWTQSNNTILELYSVTYADGKFVVATEANGVWYSTDGIVWTQSNNTDGAFTSIRYVNDKFISVGDSGIWYSDSTESTTKKRLAYQEDLEKAVLGDVAAAVDGVNKRIDSLTEVVDTKAVKADVDIELAKKADKATTEAELVKKLDITIAESDYLKKTDGKVTIDDAATPGNGIAKVYTIKQGETTVGTINIPKDLVVTEGKIVIAGDGTEGTEVIDGSTAGDKYIKLTIGNSDKPVYIAVKDLVDVYTVAKDATEVQLSLNDSNELGATIVNGSIAKAKLDASVQASLDKADAAAVKTEVDSALETINGTLEGHAGRLLSLEEATTLEDANAYTDSEIQKLNGVAQVATINEHGHVVIKSEVGQNNGSVVNSDYAVDVILARVATTGLASDIEISDEEDKITATTVEGALTELAKAIDSHHTVMTTGDTAGTIKYGDEGCGDNYHEVAVAYKDGENLGQAVARIDESVATLTSDENTEGSVAKIAKDAADAALASANGAADSKITTAIEALDSTASQTAGTDGLALSITQVDGKVTEIAGSIAANTYDAYGAAATVKTEVIGTDTDASTADTIKGAKKYTEEKVAEVSSKIYLGTTTTNLVDNNISTIKVSGSDVVAATGSMAMYNGELYIWTGSKWDAVSKHTTELAKKADITYVDTELAKKVDKTTTIAGVDLQDNITKAELLTALNVEDGAEKNVIVKVKLGDTELIPDSNRMITIDNLILDGGSAS